MTEPQLLASNRENSSNTAFTAPRMASIGAAVNGRSGVDLLPATPVRRGRVLISPFRQRMGALRGPLARRAADPMVAAWALPLSAGVVAMLVATPVSVAWGALAQSWFGLPPDYEPAHPAFLLAATAAVSSLVSLAFVLSFRFAREPLAVGVVAAGLLLAIALPAWLVMPMVAYPDVAAGPAVGMVTHLLVGAVSFAVVFLALAERQAHQG